MSGEPLVGVFLAYASLGTAGAAELVDPDDVFPGDELVHPCDGKGMSFHNFCKFLRQARLFSNDFTQLEALEFFAQNMQSSAASGSILTWETFTRIVEERALVEHPGFRPNVANLRLLQQKILPHAKSTRPELEDAVLCDFIVHNTSVQFARLLRKIWQHYATPKKVSEDDSDDDLEESITNDTTMTAAEKAAAIHAANLRISPEAMLALAQDFHLLGPEAARLDDFEVGGALRRSLDMCVKGVTKPKQKRPAPSRGRVKAEEPEEPPPPPKKETDGRFPDFLDALILMARSMFDRPYTPLSELFPEPAARWQEIIARFALYGKSVLGHDVLPLLPDGALPTPYAFPEVLRAAKSYPDTDPTTAAKGHESRATVPYRLFCLYQCSPNALKMGGLYNIVRDASLLTGTEMDMVRVQAVFCACLGTTPALVAAKAAANNDHPADSSSSSSSSQPVMTWAQFSAALVYTTAYALPRASFSGHLSHRLDSLITTKLPQALAACRRRQKTGGGDADPAAELIVEPSALAVLVEATPDLRKLYERIVKRHGNNNSDHSSSSGASGRTGMGISEFLDFARESQVRPFPEPSLLLSAVLDLACSRATLLLG